MDLVSPDGSAEHIFQDNADGILQNYPGAGFSTVPVETRDSTKQHSYYQHLQANHEDISKALYFSKEHPEGEPKENVFQNFPGILKPAKGKVFGSPPSRAVRCMDFVMDKVTHLDNLQKPCDPSLAKFVVAEHDAYVPRNNVAHLQDVWPGCQVDYIDSGHVAGSLVHQAKFRKAITQMMNKLWLHDSLLSVTRGVGGTPLPPRILWPTLSLLRKNNNSFGWSEMEQNPGEMEEIWIQLWSG